MNEHFHFEKEEEPAKVVFGFIKRRRAIIWRQKDEHDEANAAIVEQEGQLRCWETPLLPPLSFFLSEKELEFFFFCPNGSK